MRVNARKITEKIERSYPLTIADEWDNVGYQIGNINRVVDKIMVCLEVTDRVIDEAIESCIDLIIAHHPLIFKAPKTLAEHHPKARLMTRLIKENIGLYVMHTNADNADYSLNDMVAQRLQLSQIKPLVPLDLDPLYKIFVGVPQASLAKLEDAIFNAGAGKIVPYEKCAYRSFGQGSFKPLVGANPAIGEIDKISYVEEVKFETIVRRSQINDVVDAIGKAHPYELPAIDIFALQKCEASHALGRMGELPAPMQRIQFAEYLKQKLSLRTVKLCNSTNNSIRRVAIITGAGMDFIDQVAKTGVDAFITGDVRYHEAMETQHYGIMIADVGHYESEIVFSEQMTKILTALFEREDYDVLVEASRAERPLFNYY